MLNLAYFSPLPPSHTGIADYSAELLPALSRYANLTVFHETPEMVAPTLKTQFPILPHEDYPSQRWSYDLPFYQMGNSATHTALYPMALRYPGVITLHDFVLHQFIEALTRRQGRVYHYLQEIAYSFDEDRFPFGSYPSLHRAVEKGDAFYDLTPLNQRLVDRSLGVLVHSHYVRRRLQKQRRDRPVRVIHHQMEPASMTQALRQMAGWPDEAVVVAVLGQITWAKRVDVVLRVFRRLHQAFPHTRLLLVGEAFPAELDLPTLLTETGLGEVVHYTGFVPDLAQFVNWIAAADFIVNLRHPTTGETSGTALRALAQGKPVIVFDQGWYAELPSEIAWKVPVMDEEALYQAMQTLVEEPALRQKMGHAAAQYILTHCGRDKIAQEITTFLAEVIAMTRQRLPQVAAASR